MSKFCPLFSSSKGNSIVVSGGGTTLLIDAGVSFRMLDAALSEQEFSPHCLDGVLITHEHSDHIGGLKTLLKKTHIPLYASRGTLDYLWLGGYIPAHTQAVVCDGSVMIGGIEASAFETPHDATHSVGYRFLMPDGRKIGIATDLGYVTDSVRANLTGCDLIMLESNYDPGMLDCSYYPYVLKRRIKSNYGHLSNEDCAGELLGFVRSGTTRLVLGHLSEQNNIPQLAAETAHCALDAARLRKNIDYTLFVAPPRGHTQAIVF